MSQKQTKKMSSTVQFNVIKPPRSKKSAIVEPGTSPKGITITEGRAYLIANQVKEDTHHQADAAKQMFSLVYNVPPPSPAITGMTGPVTDESFDLQSTHNQIQFEGVEDVTQRQAPLETHHEEETDKDNKQSKELKSVFVSMDPEEEPERQDSDSSIFELSSSSSDDDENDALPLFRTETGQWLSKASKMAMMDGTLSLQMKGNTVIWEVDQDMIKEMGPSQSQIWIHKKLMECITNNASLFRAENCTIAGVDFTFDCKLIEMAMPVRRCSSPIAIPTPPPTPQNQQYITSTLRNKDPVEELKHVIGEMRLGKTAIEDLDENDEELEFLLRDQDNRFVLFPIQHDRIWFMYKKAEASFWVAEEVDLGSDRFDQLSQYEQHFVRVILAFFAASDGIVLENLGMNMINLVKIPEVRSFYSYQMFNENVHSETYSLLIDTYIKDAKLKEETLHALDHFPCIKKKADWALKYIYENAKFANRDDLPNKIRNRSFATLLVVFAIVEGVYFSGAFCSIFWLKKRGLLPGLTFSNELISRDEGLHTDFACLLYSMLNNKLPEEEVVGMMKEAVLIEDEFINEALRVDLIGMNTRLMSQYIRFVADRLMDALGYAKIYNVQNPFEWMEMISLQGKTNFFEKRVGDYQKSGVMAAYFKHKKEMEERANGTNNHNDGKDSKSCEVEEFGWFRTDLDF